MDPNASSHPTQPAASSSLPSMNGSFFSRYKFLVVAAIIVGIVGIAVTVAQIRRQQETRSQASEGTVSILLNPETASKNVGEEFNVQLAINADVNNVTGVDITFSFDKDILEFQGISGIGGGTAFNSELINGPTNDGTYRYAAVTTSGTAPNGFITLGNIKLKGKAAGSGKVQIQKAQITAVSRTGALNTAGNSTGTYTISSSTVASPTAPISQVVSPTNSPTPTGGIGGIPPTPTPPVGCAYQSVCPTGCPVSDIACNLGPCKVTLVCASPTPTSVVTTPTVTQEPHPISPTPTSIASSPTPTPTFAPGSTLLTLSLELPGIGTTSVPVRKVVNGTVFVFDQQNNEVKKVDSTFAYDAGKFVGTVNLGPEFPSGNYTIRVKLTNSLRKTVPGVYTITKGQDTTLFNGVALLTGDINNDNVLDLKDYNLMISCYSTNVCAFKEDSDFNIDGVNDEIDVNILQRGFASRGGD